MSGVSIANFRTLITDLIASKKFSWSFIKLALIFHSHGFIPLEIMLTVMKLSYAQMDMLYRFNTSQYTFVNLSSKPIYSWYEGKIISHVSEMKDEDWRYLHGMWYDKISFTRRHSPRSIATNLYYGPQLLLITSSDVTFAQVTSLNRARLLLLDTLRLYRSHLLDEKEQIVISVVTGSTYSVQSYLDRFFHVEVTEDSDMTAVMSEVACYIFYGECNSYLSKRILAMFFCD